MSIICAFLVTLVAFNAYSFILTAAQSNGISSNPNYVQFMLYPNPDDNQDNDVLIYNNKTSILASRFNVSKKLIIYTSGFLQNLTTDQAIKNDMKLILYSILFGRFNKRQNLSGMTAYLQVGFANTANIIVVDWGALSGNRSPQPSIYALALLNALPLYIDAKNSVYIVARRIQQFISFLGDNGLSPPGGAADIHLIGTSLGAQIMGMVGSYYKAASEESIGRITGIEPAYPIFQLLPPSQRLDISDAKFVVSIHTNQGLAGWLGPIGGVDFFINGGGPMQPECVSNITDLFCSHILSVAFYAKSILDIGETIKAKSCTWPFNPICYLFGYGSSTQFGEYCPTSTPYTSYFLDMTSTY